MEIVGGVIVKGCSWCDGNWIFLNLQSGRSAGATVVYRADDYIRSMFGANDPANRSGSSQEIRHNVNKKYNYKGGGKGVKGI